MVEQNELLAYQQIKSFLPNNIQFGEFVSRSAWLHSIKCISVTKISLQQAMPENYGLTHARLVSKSNVL